MAKQRQKEILDAFETCILKHGIPGTSLALLAEQAQVKRSILRHYIGNRDQIIERLGDRWFDSYAGQWQQILLALPSTNRLEALFDVLFSKRDRTYARHIIIGEALFVEGKRLPGLKQRLQRSIKQFIDSLSQEIERQFPHTNAQDRNAMAHGIHSINMMCESLIALDAQKDIPQLKQAALLLLNSAKVRE
jgi:AcrR family transcriptional regulator